MNLEHPENSAEQRTTEAGVNATQNKRRNLIQTGLVGCPVLLALKSTPVLAANCKLPSGFSVSGNFSRNGTTLRTQAQRELLDHQRDRRTEGQALRPSQLQRLHRLERHDLRSALAKGNTNVHAKIVAALLSAEAGSFLPAATAGMWNLGVIGRAYPASAGDSRDAAEVEAYLDHVLS